MAESWVEKTVKLKANTITEVQADYGKLMNTFIVKNLSQYPVYAGLKPTLTQSDYEIQVQPGDYGIIVRPYEFQKVYLLTSNDISVTVYMVWTQNPMILLPNMAKPVESTNVDVIKTVGLKASELNLDANKNLGVKVNNDITVSGWTWKKVTASGAGDVTVKPSSGKVALLVNDSAATIMLKDGTNQAWKTGDFISYGCPLLCTNSIVVNFSAAGSAWILYQ